MVINKSEDEKSAILRSELPSYPVKTQETVEVSMSNDSSASAVPPSASIEVPAQVSVGEKVERSPGMDMYKLETGEADSSKQFGRYPVSNSHKFSLTKPVQERFLLPMSQPHHRGPVP